jgi:2-polyprenyl-6-methoxyphenol hydroxylase-like FAD-dependent oxidoreductase
MEAGVDVLIVGAGPTGLVLALWLTRLGVSVRIVDCTAAPGTTSRALAVQGRTLESYLQLGIADRVVAAGRQVSAVNLWVQGHRRAHVFFGDLGRGISPFPFALIYPQDEHERMLVAELAVRGVHVERQTELIAFSQNADDVTATLRRADGTDEPIAVRYLAGCDGAHSIVRESLGIGFGGGTYDHVFYVADVDAHGNAVTGELQVDLDVADFLAIFPLAGEGRVRLVGTVRDDAAPSGRALTFDDIKTASLARMGITVDRTNWFSTYHVHHRVADHFRGGRAFLLGDAAHIHSPVGGQGMNTGIGDATNLGWKLAAVLKHDADPALLDTYEPERIAFARRLVATTDRGFTAAVSPTRTARFVRMRVVPALLPIAAHFRVARTFLYRTVSQTAVEYRDSALSRGRAGPLHGGDRLPWLDAAATAAPTDNFAPLTALWWQLHVYGTATPALRAAADRAGLPLHEFPWQPAMRRQGFVRDHGYVVRPDGYIGLIVSPGAAGSLDAYRARRFW